ncbi:MAG: NAD(+)/NADH kinase [Bacteroidales bacterium]|nr:NAD(+)/NADH kinase [Bacteroidales bacterium]
MKLAIYIKSDALRDDPRSVSLKKNLSKAGAEVYDISTSEDIVPGTDMLLSVGGDGTFLSAAKRACGTGIPVLGVNLGRLGFLSEYRPEEVLKALSKGKWSIEERSLLKVDGAPSEIYPYVLNEVSLRRSGPSILGIKVEIDGLELPAYWADGLLISTASGSTAYNLSAGGPICLPEARVLIVTPLAPHNLNVRPLILPDTARISLSLISRDAQVQVGMDNRNFSAPSTIRLDVSLAQFSLKRVRLGRESFVRALTDKLFWGEDIRNAK